AEKTRVRVGPVVVFSKGRSAGTAARKRAEKALQAEEVALRVDLGLGKGSARVFTCDLTYDYVKINAEYTT
ncbi:MAG: bifunctional ornithine acetyltransferase/N-acetylglutamate synthase, partial [Myxococcota bacterium]